jgi:hypothetical protein
MSAIDIIKFVKYAGCYSNVLITYRFLLTVSVTATSAEIKIEVD